MDESVIILRYCAMFGCSAVDPGGGAFMASAPQRPKVACLAPQTVSRCDFLLLFLGDCFTI